MSDQDLGEESWCEPWRLSGERTFQAEKNLQRSKILLARFKDQEERSMEVLLNVCVVQQPYQCFILFHSSIKVHSANGTNEHLDSY